MRLCVEEVVLNDIARNLKKILVWKIILTEISGWRVEWPDTEMPINLKIDHQACEILICWAECTFTSIIMINVWLSQIEEK